MRQFLARIAAGAPVPVFAIAGAGAREQVQDLRLDPGVRLVDSPREANVLLVAGAMPESLAEPLQRIHDAMSHPRCTVVAASPEGRDLRAWLPDATAVALHEPIAGALVDVHREILRGDRPSEPALLPDVEPAPWRGVGPFGQGGTGMTGGTPYGRPMADLLDDGDGLRLDALPLTVGPFFPRFPSGLILQATLAGDVVVESVIETNPFADLDFKGVARRSLLEPFLHALSEPVPIAELELARARSHLRWLADALITQGLHALGVRALALAARVRPGDGAEVQKFERLLRGTQVFRWSLGCVGPIAAERLATSAGGPVARASGIAEDARADDPAYRELGFAPVTQRAGDAAARWRQRLAEAEQALDLAGRAGTRQTELRGRVEGPRGLLLSGGAATGRLHELVPELLAGREWGDAVTTIVSLDLDLEEAALAAQLTAGVPVA